MTSPSGGTSVRIGIDGFNLAMAQGTGIATYARVLSRCLTQLGHPVDVLYGLPMSANASPIMREVAFFDRLDQEPRRAPDPVISARWWRERAAARRGCEAMEMPMTGLVDRRGFRMPDFDRILNVSDLFQLAVRHFRQTRRFLRVRIPDGPAIMHWTYPLPIVVEGARNIYTVHDLVPLRLPHTTLDDKGYHLNLVRSCIAEGAAICTVSEASRADILRVYPEAAGKVVNTYESIDLPEQALPEAADLADFLGGVFGLVPRGYFLFFGALEPKKNIGRLLEAYLSAGTSAPLVLVGGRSWKAQSELRLLRLRASDQPGGPRIRRIDYLPFGTLLRLIRGARAVLFPSLYEGFGLPVAEAMALGTATLTSTEASLPEIAGDASVLVDPYDTEAIARGIRMLDQDEALRRRLEAAGPPQAARFGAAPYRAALTAMYADVMTKTPSGRR
ncbi:glycosyltransferase family 4 protein [Rhodopila sp.]|uniref:glycosyltransferase family 4 protein n=1 Tax=Rhodopila sp. TaxID=2480087 RepID=UPI003D0A46E6